MSEILRIEIDPKRPMCDVIVEVQARLPGGSYVAFVKDRTDNKFYALTGLSLEEMADNYLLITGTVLPHKKGETK